MTGPARIQLRRRVARLVLSWAVVAVVWAVSQWIFPGRDRSFGELLLDGVIFSAVLHLFIPIVETLIRRWKRRHQGEDTSDQHRV